jgi:hypothetical protein
MEKESSKVFVRLDVHRGSIDVALAERDSAVRHHGQIGDTRAAWQKLVRHLVSRGRPLVFVYESEPCGYGMYRELTTQRHECWAVQAADWTRPWARCAAHSVRSSPAARPFQSGGRTRSSDAGYGSNE